MCAFAVVFLPKIIPSRERKKEKKYQGVSQVGLRLYFAVPLFFFYIEIRPAVPKFKIQKKKREKEEEGPDGVEQKKKKVQIKMKRTPPGADPFQCAAQQLRKCWCLLVVVAMLFYNNSVIKNVSNEKRWRLGAVADFISSYYSFLPRIKGVTVEMTASRASRSLFFFFHNRKKHHHHHDMMSTSKYVM